MLGNPIDALVLQSAAGLSAERLSEALDEMVSLRIMKEEEARDRYRFNHELTARVLSRSVVPQERSRIFEAAARAIDRLPDPGEERRQRGVFYTEQAGTARWMGWWRVGLVAAAVILLSSTIGVLCAG